MGAADRVYQTAPLNPDSGISTVVIEYPEPADFLRAQHIGNNRDSEALRMVGREMLAREQAEERIIVLICDGSPSARGVPPGIEKDPDDPYGDRVWEKDLSNAIAELRSGGIRVFGLGIAGVFAGREDACDAMFGPGLWAASDSGPEESAGPLAGFLAAALLAD